MKINRRLEWNKQHPEQCIKARDHFKQRHPEYYKEYPWRRHCYNAKARTKGQHGKSYEGLPFTLTVDQVKLLWERDKAFLLKNPELDRIVNKLGYTFENCQFIEKKTNLKKQRQIT